MYALKDTFPYAYALIRVLTSNLILKSLAYICYLFKRKELFGEVHLKLTNGSALVWEGDG